eukprot:888034-Pyramimonas_sp.AAC.1
MTQGSNLSPGVCNAVCCYLERKQCLVPAIVSLPHVQHVNSVICRWTDDIFGVLCFWTKHGNDEEGMRAVKSATGEFIKEFSSAYTGAVHSRITRKINH